MYNIIDTEFECETAVWANFVANEMLDIAISGLEYNKRNYPHQEIIKNLFVYNLHLCNKMGYTFEKILSYQNTYIDMFFNDLNFSKLYYKDLEDILHKYKAFL